MAVTARRPLPLVARTLLVATAAPALAHLDLDRLQRVLEPRRRSAPPEPGRVLPLGHEYAALVDAVIRKGRPIVRPGCMTRGITLYALLRRAGVDVGLRFGVGRPHPDTPAVEGHCWLVLDGEPFLERTDPRPLFTGVATITGAGVA